MRSKLKSAALLGALALLLAAWLPAQTKSDYPWLAWDKVVDPGGGQVLYTVERALNGNTQAWTAVALTDRTFFFDAETLPGLTYNYRVRAQAANDATTLSEPSVEDVQYLMPSKLPAPYFVLKGVMNASDLRNVFYLKAGAAIDVPFECDESLAGRILGFYVYRATGVSTSKTKVATLAPTARVLTYVMPGGSTAEYRLELVAVTRDVVTGGVREYGAASEQVIVRRLKT